MQQQYNATITNIKLITSKTVFVVSILVLILTILSVWLFGLGQHRTIFENSILSVSALSIIFFLFLSIGLYRGVKLKDDIGKIKIQSAEMPNIADSATISDYIYVGDGLEGIIVSILLWIVVTFLLAAFIWFFGAVLWTGTLVFITMLYWIFFRALRLVFKNSNKCKNDLMKSMSYGLFYTILYSFWIYGIILTAHYLI